MNVVVVDIGGTNARFALARRQHDAWTISGFRTRKTGQTSDLGRAIEEYIAGAGIDRSGLCAVAIAAAGPLQGEGDGARVRLTNAPLEISAAAVSHAAKLPCVLINDFAAVAYAIPALREQDLMPIGGGQPVAGAPQLALGPGTGLGVALRVPAGTGAVIVASEGGHAGLAPFDDETLALWPRLARAMRGHLQVEDALAGPGLARLYAALAETGGLSAERLDPSEIAERGLSQSDALCARTVALFTRWLGHYAGSLTLITGARGGLYLAGGILPSWGERFDVAAFRAAFDAQGMMQDYVRAVPIALIRHPEPALLGLAACAAERVSPSIKTED
jgi:glucokinase